MNDYKILLMVDVMLMRITEKTRMNDVHDLAWWLQNFVGYWRRVDVNNGENWKNKNDCWWRMSMT